LSNAIEYNSSSHTVLTIDQTCSSSSCPVHTIVLIKGVYKIELWGSQGGTATYAAAPGNGSYVSGNITTKTKMTIYAYIGNRNGFNGGAVSGSGVNVGACGGGATDIRLNGTGLDNRIMIAAGGGGGGGHSNCGASSGTRCYGGVGGNGDQDAQIISYSSYGYTGLKGTLSSGGAGGAGGTISFTSRTDYTYYPASGGGGGGGYYGGGGGGSGATSGGSANSNGYRGNSGTKGSGGSGARATHTNAVEGYFSYPGAGGGGGSSYIDTGIIKMEQMYNGGMLFPNVLGTTQIGNQRNGALKITQIGKIELPPTSHIISKSFYRYEIFLEAHCS
jgi:hypothetical protein